MCMRLLGLKRLFLHGVHLTWINIMSEILSSKVCLCLLEDGLCNEVFEMQGGVVQDV
ncbi:hypothetical protein ERO13_D01G079750v2 [Gossypium hirsutum]|uniref:Uncharacterized protein n=2 Tax=Gossypium TaxID=3633 RepID=A0A5D2M7F9_GOSTO|nr:hypothetical protein ERO13_D01G079750v2 [Gossypium hirsutum]TYG82676.1 hypothetical protein ES288_D01G108400v1 [Gossypium darwinii]TYH87264.1 hypothetical protein ES332_D01G105000v1 [Gossypium tomentosum]